MTRHGIAGRYAKALFNLDVSKGVLEKRIEDFELLLGILQGESKLEHLFSAPQLKVEEKKQILHSLMQKRLDKVLLSFLSFLIEKGRWSYLRQIARHYHLLVDRYLGIWEARLVTAVAIDREMEERLKLKLQKKFDKQIKLKKEVDPNLIGGATLMLENEMIDWSLSGKLKKMKKELQK